MLILTQFIFRVSFGLAAAMAGTSARQVTSGYYRNHLYVILGLNVLGVLVALSQPEKFVLWPPLSAAAFSYLGAVLWLYEQPRAGVAALVLISALSLAGAWLAMPERASEAPALVQVLRWLDPVSSGLVLGFTLAAMFLGHWYLNTPTMKLVPLKRLVLAMAAALFIRAIVCGAGLALAYLQPGAQPPQIWMVVLRWLAGLIGALVVTFMTWETLKIPNTQSATGILYVGVILTFIGELCSLLMSQSLPAGV